MAGEPFVGSTRFSMVSGVPIGLEEPGGAAVSRSIKEIDDGAVESPPLEIYINEPQTIDDIEMWKLMSKHPEYAYFMQTRGDLLQGTFTDQRTKEMVDTIESFVNYHAASTYTPYFREAIAKHRAAVERHRKAGTLKE